MRVAVAFVLAPILPALAAFLLGWFLPPRAESNQVVDFILLVTVFSPLLSIPAAWCLGIPLYFLFRRLGWLRLQHVLLAGLLVGLLATLLFATYALVTTPNFFYVGSGKLYVHWSSFVEGISYTALFLPYALVIATLFYLLAFSRSDSAQHIISSRRNQVDA